MSESTTLVVTAMPNPDNSSEMQAYLKGAMPLLAGAGGTLVKRLKVQGSLTGKPSFGMVMVMDFPDKAKIEAVFASESYAALVPNRDKGFSSIDIVLAGDL